MKNSMIVVIAFLIFVLPTLTFALNEHSDFIRPKMMNYIKMKKNWNKEEGREIQARVLSEEARYGYDFSLMDEGALSELIRHQRDYLAKKQFFVRQLTQVYFQNHADDFKFDESDLDVIRGRKCTIWEKIVASCEKSRRVLVYEAQYLNQKISEIETLESSLTYAIAGRIVEEDKEARDVAATSKVPYKIKMN